MSSSTSARRRERRPPACPAARPLRTPPSFQSLPHTDRATHADRQNRRRTVEAPRRRPTRRLRADDGQPAPGPSVADGDRAQARRRRRRQHLRQPAPVRAERGLRPLPADHRRRPGRARAHRRRRPVRAARAGDVPDAAGLPGAAAAAGRRARRRVAARLLPRRVHRRAEALQPGPARRRRVRQEGPAAAEDRPRHGPAVQHADPDRARRDDPRADGLALSSRNNYLTPAERAEAPNLYRILRGVADEIARGRARLREPRGLRPRRARAARLEGRLRRDPPRPRPAHPAPGRLRPPEPADRARRRRARDHAPDRQRRRRAEAQGED